MIPFTPIKILFRVGGVEIYSWGFALFLSFAVGFFITLAECKRKRLDLFHMLIGAILVVVGAMVGARALYVIEHLGRYLVNPLEAFSVWQGGLSAIGGMLGAFLFAFLYGVVYKLPTWDYADAFVPSLCLGISITRIGCFLNWDDYGIASTLPWAVNAGDFARHPTQIYLALNGLILFFVFLRIRNNEALTGKLFPLFLVLYGSSRFFIEFLRDSERYVFQFTAAQLMIIPLILISIVFLFRKDTYARGGNPS